MADCASDARIICTALGIDRLAMWACLSAARLTLEDEPAARALFGEDREELLAALVDEAICMQQAIAPGIEGPGMTAARRSSPGDSACTRYPFLCC